MLSLHIPCGDVVGVLGLHILGPRILGDVVLIAGDVALGDLAADLAEGDEADGPRGEGGAKFTGGLDCGGCHVRIVSSVGVCVKGVGGLPTLGAPRPKPP